MPKSNEVDTRTIEQRFVYGLASIREVFAKHPEYDEYVDDLAQRMAKAYRRIKDEELEEAA